MKYISRVSDRLGEAYKRIEELELENARLRKALALSQIDYPNKKSRPSSCSTKSPETLTSASKHRYAQPTEASRNREKSPQQTPKGIRLQPPIVFVADSPHEDGYRYKDGVPREVYTRGHGRDYMNGTRASERRGMEAFLERWAKRREREEAARKRQRLRSPPTSPDYPYSAADDEYNEPFPQDFPPTPLESNSGIEDKQDKDLEIRSRLRDNLRFNGEVTINNESGFGYLRRAFLLAQEAVHAVGETGAPGWRRFRGGPHVVRLGRDELMSWLGYCGSQHLARNGYSSSTVYSRLLDVVPLRNAVSHPSEDTFEDPEQVDHLVSLSQALAVVLGDEDRAFQLRKIRDDLRDEANRSLQDVLDLWEMSFQPYHPGIECQYHHIKLFEAALRHYSCHGKPIMEEDRRILDIARRWKGTDNSTR
ncbi:hypothetical protein O1611_g1327 [Lasiodiplodia mahajangana]|uniref:Uncharacterized protein n=1 Tax=Lasiodiplodia mahajangana TaxID=1108764 RepID=A0ACC2JXS4_9PEZI|nr:hypothetical protein O1611_g1327 [Lasiodiplodia mahajangana]